MAASRTDVLVALPRPLTSLIGREQELNHLYELLKSDVALVTITGFGGIGKTRLSLQAALELEPVFDAGALFASLASVTLGSSLPRAIAVAAGLDESIDSVPSLASALGSSSRLLVLDNLEQIPDAAEVVFELLQAMPNCTILATSRARLDIRGEYVLPLEPLETKSDDPRTLPAVQLFVERAQAANPSVPTDDESISIIADICQKLDGIPLALELAAARLAIFSLTELRDELEHTLPVLASKRVDMPGRQRTMRNAIGWTYELLEQSERRLFTWLSVYEPDFSLESVRHVATQLELTDDPLDIIQFLVSRSLIRPGRRESESPRYQMLQMMREFGHEQLLGTGEDHLARHSHAMDMVTLAERAVPHFLTRHGKRWTLLLQSDIENILAATKWTSEKNQTELLLRILASIWRFADTNGFRKQFFAFAPEQLDPSIDSELRARASIGIGYLQLRAGQLNEAELLFSTALDLAARLPDQSVNVSAQCGLGAVALAKHDMTAMEAIYSGARDLAKEIEDSRGYAVASGELASCYLQTGKTSDAIPLLHELIADAQQRGDIVSESAVTGNLAASYLMNEEFDEAERYTFRSIELAEQTGNIFSLATSYFNLSGIYIRRDDFERTLELTEKGLIYARQVGWNEAEWNLVGNLAEVERQRGNYGDAAKGYGQVCRMITGESSYREIIAFSSAVMDLAFVTQHFNEAAELLGAIHEGREQIQFPPYPWEEEYENNAYEQLAPESNREYADHYAIGKALSQNQLRLRMIEICDLIEASHPATNPGFEAAPEPVIALTPREAEVLEMLAKGLTNKEMAAQMFVSTRTVTTHLTNIFTKLDVKNRSRAVAVATEVGLV